MRIQVRDSNGNKIPSSLVLRAKRLNIDPSALSELQKMYNSDSTLRAKFTPFEALLLATMANGGLGLSFPATGDQTATVNTFVNDWKTKHPDVDLDDIPPSDDGTFDATDLGLSEDQFSALHEYLQERPGRNGWLKQ